MNTPVIYTPSVSGKLFSTYAVKAKFKPHAVIVSKGFKRAEPVKQENINSLKNLEKGTAGQWNGYMSPATRRKVKGIVENFLTAIQVSTSMQFPKSFPSPGIYPTFLTLTLPCVQHHCDNDIKKDCFIRFMEYLRGTKENGRSGWGVVNYLWVAETQKNGNIHFHVILDKALPAQRLNEIWNRFIDRLGYVDRFRNTQNYIYQDGFFVRKSMLEYRLKERKEYCRKNKIKFCKADIVKLETKRQREAYEKGVKSNWTNPPTTKIHSIQNIKKLTAYVSKYMTKAPEVNYSLKEGEALKQDNGKFYVVTSKQESFTYSITDRFTGEYTEHTETKEVEEMQEVTVKFGNRRLRGRIWGCSDSLHSDTVQPLTIDLEKYEIVWSETVTRTERKRKVFHYEKDIWGNEICVGTRTLSDVTEFREEELKATPIEYDEEARKYVSFLQTVHVPTADIEKATARAGEHFQYTGGKIIPLELQQKDVMQAYYKPMHTRYIEYYETMYRNLYPDAV